MSEDGNDGPSRRPGREANARPLARRFYSEVTTRASATGEGHEVLLDGKPARTPGRRSLQVPTLALAEAIAGEWLAQATAIDPAGMPLTRLANTAIDGVSARMSDVARDVVKFAGSDLLCYRAEYPEGLVERQARLWDPVLEWVKSEHGATFATVAGVMPVAQAAQALQRIEARVATRDPYRLTALHVMTTLMGSALLALAVLEGRLTPEAAWEAAHVDEDWQIAEWGHDDEATLRRARRWQEMQAASGLVALLGGR